MKATSATQVIQPAAAAQAPPLAAVSRRQTARPTRTSTARPSNYYSQPFSARASSFAAADHASAVQHSPGFCPALTHFTDAVAALPKEMVKHFSMLKEVEAKTHAPEHELSRLTHAVLQLGHDSSRRSTVGLPLTMNAGDGPDPTRGQATSVAMAVVPGADAGEGEPPADGGDGGRSHLFQQLRCLLHDMSMIFDEKNAVLSSANQTLARQLARMASSYQYAGTEVSDEARFGSTTHWAYADKEAKKTGSINDRPRRDGASTKHAASAASLNDGDLAASRSEVRREALLANKRNKNKHADSDFDEGQQNGKAQNGKVRKAADAGLVPATHKGAVDGQQAPKKRRVEKSTTASATTQRELLGGGMSQAKSRNTGSASRDTVPAGHGKEKARPLPLTSANSRKGKHNYNVNRTPSVTASSPLQPPTVNGLVKNGLTSQETTSYPQQDGVASSLQPDARKGGINANRSPEYVARGSGTENGLYEGNSYSTHPRNVHDAVDHATPELHTHQKVEPSDGKRTVGAASNDIKPPLGLPGPKRDSSLQADKVSKTERLSDAGDGSANYTATSNNTTINNDTNNTNNNNTSKNNVMNNATNDNNTNNISNSSTHSRSGRSAKPETPVASNFSDVAWTRPRNARAGGNGHRRSASNLSVDAGTNGGVAVPVTKRPPKRNVVHVHQQAVGPEQPHARNHYDSSSDDPTISLGLNNNNTTANTNNTNTNTNNKNHSNATNARANAEDEVDEDEAGDEPRYCYCQQVSYGEMVACDNIRCRREWFHLACAGLSRPPGSKTKWYCNECKEALKLPRPGSRN